MQAIIVYGRALDHNNKQLYSVCRKYFGKPLLTRIMDMSAYIGPDGNRFWLADRLLPKIDLCFLARLDQVRVSRLLSASA